MNARRPAIVVAGPTASGKSALALRLACEFTGCVINADSMQIYAGLRVLTARPTPADESLAPHRLYGVLPPDRVCSAALWRDLARAEMEESWRQGLVPILVGGTGLYLKALIDGLSPVPEIPAAIRTDARALLAEIGNATFHNRLAARDPDTAARLDAGNSQRLVRAWEVLEATGRPLFAWQAEPPEGAVAADWCLITLMPAATILYPACDRRFVAMMEQGALDEVRALRAQNLALDRPLMKALGVPELFAHLEGRLSLDEAIARAQRSTRNYAKRQLTWFRHQLAGAHAIHAQFSESLSGEIFSIIRHAGLTTA